MRVAMPYVDVIVARGERHILIRARQIQLNVAVRFLEQSQPRQQPHQAKAGTRVNAKNLDTRLARCTLRRAAQISERSGDLPQILLTRWRQHQSPSQSREQGSSDHGFKVGNLMTDR